jgi:hypothetical protein
MGFALNSIRLDASALFEHFQLPQIDVRLSDRLCIDLRPPGSPKFQLFVRVVASS